MVVASKKGPRWFDVDEVDAQVWPPTTCVTTLLKLEEPTALAKLSRAHDLLGLSDVQVTSQLWPVEPTCHVISPAARDSSAKRRRRIEPPKKTNWAGGCAVKTYMYGTWVTIQKVTLSLTVKVQVPTRDRRVG